MNEYFKEIPGYEGHYQISNKGQVFSCPRKNAKGRILKPHTNRLGYAYVVLSRNSKQQTFKIHRLVALCFVENPDNKPHVNHIDGNKQNNHFSNLEWCTPKENIKHSHATGLTKHAKGSESLLTKFSEELRVEIYEAYTVHKIPQSQIAIMTGVSQSSISRVIGWVEQGLAIDKTTLNNG